MKFVVRKSKSGSESKNIPAHKFVLAISSPVFYAMFYGELAETEDFVEISVCEYESLNIGVVSFHLQRRGEPDTGQCNAEKLAQMNIHDWKQWLQDVWGYPCRNNFKIDLH